jgi:hypothetical protein
MVQNAFHQDAFQKPKPKPRRLRRFLYGVAGLTALVAVLTVSTSPSVPVSDPPDAAAMIKMRDIARNLRDGAGKEQPTLVTLPWADASTAAALAGRTARLEHVAVTGDETEATLYASIPLPLGLWVNVEGYAEANPHGFPNLSGKIGRIPIPAFMTSWIISGAEAYLHWKGVDVPARDGVVHEFSLSSDGVTTQIRLPKDKKLYRTINDVRAAGVDADAVVRHYCRIAKDHAANPSALVSTYVNRTFADVSTADEAKAAFVALAMLVVSPDVAMLAGDIKAAVKPCLIPAIDVTLLGRQDLAKHWVLSAALAATMGEDMSEAMGTWKEVADSGAGGTGFSFVDLAADRSGIAFARALQNGEEDTTLQRLRAATDQDLLPAAALQLGEGMTETQFQALYQNIDSAEYQAMVGKVDEVLSR